jgi:hypothetical protein
VVFEKLNIVEAVRHADAVLKSFGPHEPLGVSWKPQFDERGIEWPHADVTKVVYAHVKAKKAKESH